ncbi:hypothetical protein [Fluviicola sp.]|jgi:hypothetical protein|uniref:hypothetical protein n=1 Tax=Fluviicola sp. TaxID=1917219 RepID=UPI0028299C2A|nr:hypothetical protein [Fluviicola sp.]MDR0801821.1 hypothetical protein [Fluviicola sp.]
MEIHYPIYRKLENFGRYYKIESPDLFTEVSLLNGKPHYQTVNAVQYPEKLRIRDMIACEFSFKEMNPEEIETYFQ